MGAASANKNSFTRENHFVYTSIYMFLIDLVTTLQKQKIPYCLVGGYALAIHGAIRGTLDIDLVVAFQEHTFIQVEAALRSLGLEPLKALRGRSP